MKYVGLIVGIAAFFVTSTAEANKIFIKNTKAKGIRQLCDKEVLDACKMTRKECAKTVYSLMSKPQQSGLVLIDTFADIKKHLPPKLTKREAVNWKHYIIKNWGSEFYSQLVSDRSTPSTSALGILNNPCFSNIQLVAGRGLGELAMNRIDAKEDLDRSCEWLTRESKQREVTKKEFLEFGVSKSRTPEGKSFFYTFSPTIEPFVKYFQSNAKLLSPEWQCVALEKITSANQSPDETFKACLMSSTSLYSAPEEVEKAYSRCGHRPTSEGLAPDLIGLGFRSGTHQFRICVEKESKDNPKFTGANINIRFLVEQNGRVKGENCQADKGAASSVFSKCICEVASKLIFPKHLAAKAVPVNYPLKLASP